MVSHHENWDYISIEKNLIWEGSSIERQPHHFMNVLLYTGRVLLSTEKKLKQIRNCPSFYRGYSQHENRLFKAACKYCRNWNATCVVRKIIGKGYSIKKPHRFHIQRWDSPTEDSKTHASFTVTSISSD